MRIENDTSPTEENMAIHKMFSLINYDLATSFIEIYLKTILAEVYKIIHNRQSLGNKESHQ